MSRNLDRQIKKYMNRRMKHLGSDIQAIHEAYRGMITNDVVPLALDIRRGTEERDWPRVEAAAVKLWALVDDFNVDVNLPSVQDVVA